MNNKPCGCGKGECMPPKAMPKMPRCMTMKPGCTCRNNNWSNDNACNAKTCQTSCNMGCDKKRDCTSNVLRNENKCGRTCDVDWAKKYERSCKKQDSYFRKQ